ncbi:MAG: hypothetical protein WCK11_05880 [Candidatus Falkowbacteria bacterium]
MSTRKKIIIFGLPLLLVLVVIFTIFNAKNKKLVVLPVPNKSVNTSTANQLWQLLKKSDCETLKTQAGKNLCLDAYNHEQFGLSQNPTYCLEINMYDSREKCLNEYIQIADKPGLCSRLSGASTKDICDEHFGRKNLGMKYCDQIKDEPNEKQECIDRTKALEVAKTGQTETCENIKTLEYSYLCEMNAMKAGGKGCEVIKDETRRNLCISRVVFDKTKVRADCDLIPDIRFKKVCQAAFDNANNKEYKSDDDNDGLNNNRELWINTDPFNSDTDGDGLSDYEEVEVYKANPTSADTDGDGINDAEEIKLGLDPEVPNKPGDKPVPIIIDRKRWWLNPTSTDLLGSNWRKDADMDGLIDVDELFYGTDPFKADSDGDGVNDAMEIKALTNPRGAGDWDFDGDGLTNKVEIMKKTNPFLADTNGDGLNDKDSVVAGVDPASNDTDNDGLANSMEKRIKTNPLNSDTDGDGVNDGDEINRFFTDPLKKDTDGDGFSDGQELIKGFDPKKKQNKI